MTPGGSLSARREALERALGEMGSVLVAYSGGVDSALLAVAAHRVLGARRLAVTADSPSLSSEQRRLAQDVASRFGFAHRMIATHELDDPLYARNDAFRCYHCKSELFHLVPLAAAGGFALVAYGLIVDDLAEFRPGHRTAAEAGVRAPLAEAGLTKTDVRALSRELGLPTADLPASPCLSSRLPYGTPVTRGALARVERAEAAVRALGFRELRVRHEALPLVPVAPGPEALETPEPTEPETSDDGVYLAEVADETEIFDDPGLEVASLAAGEARDIIVPVEIRSGTETRRFKLSVRLRLDPVDGDCRSAGGVSPGDGLP